jgi:hypothetical protein
LLDDKRKRSNHFQQFREEISYEMSILEKFEEKSSKAEEFQKNFVEQFQIKELFWKEGTDYVSKNFRNQIWDILNDEKAKILKKENRGKTDPVSIKYARKNWKNI